MTELKSNAAPKHDIKIKLIKEINFKHFEDFKLQHQAKQFLTRN